MNKKLVICHIACSRSLVCPFSQKLASLRAGAIASSILASGFRASGSRRIAHDVALTGVLVDHLGDQRRQGIRTTPSCPSRRARRRSTDGGGLSISRERRRAQEPPQRSSSKPDGTSTETLFDSQTSKPAGRGSSRSALGGGAGRGPRSALNAAARAAGTPAARSPRRTARARRRRRSARAAPPSGARQETRWRAARPP